MSSSTLQIQSPTTEALHLLNRLGFGPRPGDLEQMTSLGWDAFVQQQIAAHSNLVPKGVTQILNTLDTLRMSPVELAIAYSPLRRNRQMGQPIDQKALQEARRSTRRLVEQAIQARLLRAIASPNQLQEVMVDFWFNHFNVFVGKGLTRLWVGAYEEQAIRPHALGRFRDLLGATARHPAMLFYLDNWQNTAPNSRGARGRFKGLNENYARELMELHTLGVNGGYSQQDVIALAKILTGWGLPRLGQMNRRQAGNGRGFYFDESRHDFSNKVFLGQAIKGSGLAEGEQALDRLARHPATAKHLAYKLAQRFVADDPPASLVTQLADRFLASDGDIPTVLTVLFQSSEFRNPQFYGVKFKTPYQYVISGLRATDPNVASTNESYRLIFGVLRQMGMPLYGCQTPNGYSNTSKAWLNPDAMLRRTSFATALTTGLAGRLRKIDPSTLRQTLGDPFSDHTRSVIASSPPDLQAALMLGSPEFMYF